MTLIFGRADKIVSKLDDLSRSLKTLAKKIPQAIAKLKNNGVAKFFIGKSKLNTIVSEIQRGVGSLLTKASEVFSTIKTAVKKSIKSGVLKHRATSRVKLISTPGKTTTILGRYDYDTQAIIKELGLPKSTDFSGNIGGFNLLNVPDVLASISKDFWNEYNKPFLDAAISRGDEILMATPITKKYLYKTGTTELTGYGKEYYYLVGKGYKYVNGKMVK